MNWFKKGIAWAIAVTIVFSGYVNVISIPKANAAPTVPQFDKKSTLRKSEVELTDQRTAFSNTFLEPNGDKKLVASLTPINFQKDDLSKKTWQPIDTTLVQRTEKSLSGNRVFKNKANSFDVTFTDSLFKDGISVTNKQAKITIIPQPNFSVQSSQNSLNLNSLVTKATPNITTQDPKTLITTNTELSQDSSGTQYTYESTATGVKEEVRIDKYPGGNTFLFDLNLSGLTYEKKNNAYYFYRVGTKDLAFYIPPSFAYDSNQNNLALAEDFITYNVSTDIIQKSGKSYIQLTVDDSWLKSSNRKYPIIIDPTIESYSDLGYYDDTFVQENYHDSRYLAYNQDYLYTGYTAFWNNGSYVNKKRTRALLPFNAPNSLGSHIKINSAYVNVYQRQNVGNHGILGRMTSDYDGRNIVWDNQPTYSAETIYNQNSCTECRIDVDVTSLAKYWYESNTQNFRHGYIGFWDDTDGDNTTDVHYRQWKSINTGDAPKLVVNYTDYNAEYSFGNVHDARIYDSYSMSINVHNTGSDWLHSWDSKIDLEFYKDGQPYSREEIGLPTDVAPGGWTTINWNNRVFTDPGSYSVTTDLFNNNFGWYSLYGIGQGRAYFTINNYPEYAVEYQVSGVQTSAIAGSTMNVTMNVLNNSRYLWSKSSYKLGYHWIDNITGNTIVWDNGILSTLEQDAQPRNGSSKVILQAKVPANAGNYKLKLDMFQTGVTWFSQKGVPTKDFDITVTPASFSSMTRFGTEDYYAKLGPIDLATGNLAYGNADMSISSNTGLLSMERSYNANSNDQTYDQDANGYIRNWIINGPYAETDQTTRLTKKFVNEETIRPNTYSTSNGKVWLPVAADSSYLDINKTLDVNNIVQSGYGVNSTEYANSYIFSPVAQTAKLKLGSDDGVKAWLNNTLIYTNDITRGITLDSDTVDVNLKSGWNNLLLKISQGIGGWALSARFVDTTGKPLVGLKYALDDQDIYGDYQTMGKGWTTNFNERLFTLDESNVYYRDSTGSLNLFTKNSTTGKYDRPAGTTLDLIKNANGTFSLISKSGLKANYNILGKLSSKVDLSGNTLVYSYDSNNNCIKITDGGRYITFSYTNNRLTSAADQNNDIYTYDYDTSVFPARLVKVTDPAGNYFSYNYDSKGKLVNFINKRGFSTSILYDSNSKVSGIKDALGNLTSLLYNKNSVQITDALGRKSLAEFDGRNLLTAFTNTKNYREIYTYDGNYNIVSITPDIPESDYYFYHWIYTYDSNGNLLTETDPMGRKSSYTYSSNDLITSIDPDGSIATYAYSTDGRRLLLSGKDAKGNLTSYTYDSLGRKSSVTDPELNTTNFNYSTDGDILSITSPKNEVTVFTYDNIGRKTSDKSPLGKITAYQYNAMGLVSTTTDPNGLVLSYSYDQNGNIIKKTDPKGTYKTYEYDAIDQLLKVTDEVGAVIQYVYDAVGNKIKDIDANSKITTYKYDELNQLISQTDTSGGVSTIQYDRNGQPISISDPKSQQTSQTYDKSGNTTKVTDPDGTTNLAYDQDGKLKTATSSVNSESMMVSYDANNNITNISSNITGTVNAAYNKNDNPTTIQTPTSNINFSYDANGQVSNITTSLNNLTLTTRFTKDSEGKTTAAYKPNGDTTLYSYDKSNRITSVINRNAGKVLLSQFNYQYDKTLNITAINDGKTGITTYYNYDARNQLIKEGNKTLSYDPMGNRQTAVDASGTTTYTYDPVDSNRLIKVTYPNGQIIQYQYDANGNIIQQIDSVNGKTSYFYDIDNYFTKAILPNGSSVEYLYDKLLKLRTQRVEKDSSGVVTNITKFVYDSDRLVSETDQNGKITKSYSWDENERLISIALPDSTGTLRNFTYQKNLKEDIVGLTDQSGNLVAEYAYDAWGNITKSVTKTNSPIANIDKLNPRLYSSYWYDASLGQYFMKTRMYDTKIGRFLSKDSLTVGGSALGYNPYIYCYNNPVNQIDPSGKDPGGYAAAALAGAGFAFNLPAIPVEILVGAGIIAGVALTGWIYETYYNKEATPAANNIPATPTTITSGGSCPAPDNGNNDRNKENKNTSKNYKSKPNPKSNYTDKIESAKVENRAIQSVKDTDGFTKHGIDQAVNRSNYLSPNEILETLRNPDKFIEGFDKYGRPFEKYSKSIVNKMGKPDIIKIIINPATREIVSLY